MTAAAQRQARRRARQREGRILLAIEADEAALVEALIAAGVLEPCLSDDKRAIATATARLLQLITRDNPMSGNVLGLPTK
jgi:hypothetical protein